MPNMLPLYDFKHPRIPPTRGEARTSFDIPEDDRWWSLSGSNRRPEACKATALPAELRPRFRSGLRRRRKPPLSWLPAPSGAAAGRPLQEWRRCDAFSVASPTGRRRLLAEPQDKMVGLGRLERPTSPLSGVRSNHLSYRPQPRPEDPGRCVPECERRETKTAASRIVGSD